MLLTSRLGSEPGIDKVKLFLHIVTSKLALGLITAASKTRLS